MATITASLSTKVDARGKSEILLRFVGGRDHIFRLHSCLWVQPSRWKDNAIVVPRLATPEQHELIELRARLENLIAYLLDRWAEADTETVDRLWMQKAVGAFIHPATEGSGPSGLVEAFALFRERREPRVSHSRTKRYKVVGQALERWAKYRRSVPRVETLDKGDVQDFERFLTQEHKLCKDRKWSHLYADLKPYEMPRERGRNSIVEYLCVLRTFYHWAKREGMTKNEPFATVQIGSALYGTPYYISLEEVEQLYRADLSGRPALAVQRDIFVFQCQVGCRVGDLLRFRQTDVSDGVLEYIPGKTRGEHPRTVRVPLNATAKEILARYQEDAWPRLLPFISSKNYNEAIKDAFKLAGLTRPVTVLDTKTRKEVKRPLNEIASSHLARRTFIGNLYRAVKDPSLISSMSGHAEGSKAFARYRSIDDDIKTETVEILDRKTQGK